MKKSLLAALILAFVCGTAFSQEDKSSKDSVTVQSSETSGQAFDSENVDDEETSTGGFVPGLLHSAQDVFNNNTSYTFSIAYFKPRGLDSRYVTVAINGMEMENLVTERASYSQWGGLNRVFRWPENVLPLHPSTFTFGDLGGALNFNTRASSYRKQIHANYSLSNRSYNNRLMFTYASGLMKNGWAVAASASTRFGSTLSYVDGSSYLGGSYFLSVEKVFNSEHSLNLSVWGSPTQRSLQSNATQEVYDLAGSHYYNANWGWYNGEQRNARIRTTFEPVFMLTYNFIPDNNKLQITANIGTTFGKQSTTSLNWANVPDPRPDYYRNLPSYYKDDPLLFNYYTEQWTTNENFRQIDWMSMYETNQLAAQLGNQAQYIVENRIISHVQAVANGNIVASLTDHIKLMGGVDIRTYKQRNYKTINDLLGGSYWLNMDKYADGESPDNPYLLYDDLDNIGAHLGVGDKFGYDYAYHINKQNLWATAKFTYAHIDFHVGVNGTTTEMWRHGYMRNGRFPDNSQGDSEKKIFPDGGVKAGITYKINGRNYLVLNAQAQTMAPRVLDVFISPTIRNDYVDNLKSEKDLMADFSYIMRYPFMRMRLTAYYGAFMDVTSLFSFYHDDYGSYVNYAMTGINKCNYGFELGVEVPIGSMFTVYAAGTWGDHRYTNRPDVTITADNGYDILGNGESQYTETVYWKNFHVAGTPQVAATLGVKFNYKYWFVSVNANYFDKIYADINPERRTTAARGTLSVESPLYQSLVAQERLKGQFTMDASIGKSWKIKNSTLGFNISVTNLTNNKNLVTTAWEQRRFDYKNYDVNKYPNKYYYALGTTFYLGINYTFQ